MYADGGTRVVDGETLAGRCAISRSPRGSEVMFGPVVTTEAHLAFSGARTLSNNTAGMTAMIEALSFLRPHCPVAHDEQSCIYYDFSACCWCMITHAVLDAQMNLTLSHITSLFLLLKSLLCPCTTKFIRISFAAGEMTENMVQLSLLCMNR